MKIKKWQLFFSIFSEKRNKKTKQKQKTKINKYKTLFAFNLQFQNLHSKKNCQ